MNPALCFLWFFYRMEKWQREKCRRKFDKSGKNGTWRKKIQCISGSMVHISSLVHYQRFHKEGNFLPEGNFSVRKEIWKEIEFGRKLEGNLIFGKEIRRKLYFSYYSLKKALISPKINEKFYRISYPKYFFPYSHVSKLCRNSEIVRFCLRCNVLVFRNWHISLILQLHYV